MVKKIMALFFLFCLSFQITEISSEAYSNIKDNSEYSVNEIIPQEIYAYITVDIRKDVLTLLEDAADNFGIHKEDIDQLTWDNAYAIYNMDEEVQKREYFFPIVDREKKVIANIAVLDTEYGIQYSISQDMISSLNKLDDWKKCIFYKQGNTILAQKNDIIYNITEGKVSGKFADKTIQEKKKIISNDLKKAKQIEIKQSASMVSKKELRSYTPSFSNDLGYYYLKLYNAQGQGDYNLCWAASAATIINYRLGQNVTAKNIADKLGKGYNEGGSLNDIGNGLRAFGIYHYYSSHNMLSFENVMKNIKAKYPIAMICQAIKTGVMGHVVTIYGFRNLTSGKYLICWDSYEKPREEGNVRIMNYNQNGSIFLSENAEYIWNETVFGTW